MYKMFGRVVLFALALVIAVVPLVVAGASAPPIEIPRIELPRVELPREVPPGDAVVISPDVVVPEPLPMPLPPARPGAADTGMETALIAVRRLIDIDDDIFTDFSYSSTFSNWETREGLIWNFTWSGENAHAFASVTPDGKLLSFNMFHFDTSPFGFAQISRDVAVDRAVSFIRRANPGMHQYFTVPDSVNANLHSSEFFIAFNAQVSGHAFPASQISVGVDKFTGEVTSYSTRNIDPNRFNFESVAGLISQNEAVSAFVEKLGLTLEYRSSFDSINNSIRIFPIYLKDTGGMRFISATTGEVLEFVHDVGVDGTLDAMFAAGAAPAAPQVERDEMAAGEGFLRQVTITPAERAAIEQVAGFLTSEQALEKLLEAVQLPDIDVNAFDDKHISLERSFMQPDRFIYNISLFRNLDWDAAETEVRGIFGTVDAAGGRVRSFNIFHQGVPVPLGGTVLPEGDAQAAVEAFLQRIAPAEFALTRPALTMSVIEPFRFGFSGTTSFNYVRYANDIPFRDNGISVTYNHVTRQVTSFSLNWFDNAVFPGLGNILAPQEALSRFVSQNGSDIIFITTGEGNANIVYDFGSAMIDPFTGGTLDWAGAPIDDITVTPDYSDVIGHWSEIFVMRLLENGVYNWSGSFEPDRVMTEAEFVAYIMQIEQPWMARMQPQAFLTQRGINIEVSAERPAVRQFAARIIVEYLGFGQLGVDSRWFVYPFNDDVADEFKGFITIAHMLDIVDGDADGNFNATGNVTRGQAAAMLHNTVLARMAP